MERETFFADVILPLALPRVLTYRIPKDLTDYVQLGHRVVVPIGKHKKYTGIVERIHTNVPTNYEARYLDELLDEQPLLFPLQIKFWKWIAEYYCCSVGEVMNAALPGGLKLSSETKFALIESEFSAHTLSEKELLLIECLQKNGTMKVEDIASALDVKNPSRHIKSLMEKRIVAAEDEIKEKFKPRTADMISLGSAAQSEEGLKIVFEALEKKKVQKQIDALMVYLQLSNYDQGQQTEVDRLKIQNASQTTSSVIQQLIKKNIFQSRTVEIGRLPSHLLASEDAKPLSEAQAQALNEIVDHFAEKDVVLLEGVTSSGKTEVYIHLIEQMLMQNKQVLFLLPEIALTTQIIHRLRKHFGKRVGIYHSGYSDNERTEVWNKVLADSPGECDVILGARSAIFLPFNRLGLVIVDEEHENSFKQHDPAPRYHARDAAIVLASAFNAKTLLGSATPSIETYWNAKKGRFGLVRLMERYGGVSLPFIEVTDIRKDVKAKTMKGNLSPSLIAAMKSSLEKGEQIILFQNRRGYSPIWQCHTCGWIPSCTRCDVSLTYHKNSHQLKCHYCGYSTDPPKGCQACGNNDLRMLGFGTEKIEEDIETAFPDIVVQRMDLDTTRNKNSYQKIIQDFEVGKIQVLVGTQMVTKGLDFDNVSLVGILNADKMMNFPDYKSIERSYQLMMQVSGRAGRRGKQGRVIIQTFNPTHWLFNMIEHADYQALYAHEIAERQHYAYPPYVRMIKLVVKHKDESTAYNAAIEARKRLSAIVGEGVLGPEKPYVGRINNYYLQNLLIKQPRNNELKANKVKILDTLRDMLSMPEYKAVRVSIDVDPI